MMKELTLHFDCDCSVNISVQAGGLELQTYLACCYTHSFDYKDLTAILPMVLKSIEVKQGN